MQLLADFLQVPEDLLVTVGIVMALSFCGAFGLLSLVVMAAEILGEEP